MSDLSPVGREETGKDDPQRSMGLLGRRGMAAKVQTSIQSVQTLLCRSQDGWTHLKSPFSTMDCSSCKIRPSSPSTSKLLPLPFLEGLTVR